MTGVVLRLLPPSRFFPHYHGSTAGASQELTNWGYQYEDDYGYEQSYEYGPENYFHEPEEDDYDEIIDYWDTETDPPIPFTTGISSAAPRVPFSPPQRAPNVIEAIEAIDEALEELYADVQPEEPGTFALDPDSQTGSLNASETGDSGAGTSSENDSVSSQIFAAFRGGGEAGEPDDTDDGIKQALNGLIGSKVVDVVVERPGWDLKLLLFPYRILKVFCDHVPGDPSFDGNWELHTIKESYYFGPGFSTEFVDR